MTFLGCLAAIAACGDDEPSTPRTGETGGGGGGGEGGNGGNGGEPIPVWDLDRSEPWSKSKPGFTEVTHPVDPGDPLEDLKAPFRTNAYWMNFVLGGGSQRVNTLPYDIKALGTGLAVSVPEVTVGEASVTTSDVSQLRLTATQLFQERKIKAYDLLSVTVEWTAAAGTMTAPIVQGMPYITALYDGLRPSLITSDGVGISAVNNNSQENVVSGNRFEVSLSNGQTWLIYAAPALTLEWSSSTIIAEEAYTGSIRLALLPTPDAAEVLDNYSKAIPVGGDIEASVDVEQGTASVSLVWKKQGTGDLLTMAMPHHVAGLDGAEFEDLEFTSVVGPLKATAGSTWKFNYQLNDIVWDAPRDIPKDYLDEVLAALEADKEFVPDADIVGSDPYRGGKQLAKLARLVVIAEAIQEQDTADELRDLLKPLVGAWLDGTNENPLVYDTTWGGIVTTNGVEDSTVDNGQGYYDDHHFQYGYLLYAAAVVAKGDEAWRTKYGEKALWLARDIANPSDDDKHFPAFRHMDWYRGHSWALGLSENANGRSQGSSSEAVHAWYAVQLLGNALGDVNVENLGRVLLATEAASARTYWQVEEGSSAYPSPFADNHAVGVLWSSKADFESPAGKTPDFTYASQIGPVTPISEVTLSEAWLTDAWPLMEAAYADASDEQRAFLDMGQAVLDRDAAWDSALNLIEFDDANSMTATLYWIATRP